MRVVAVLIPPFGAAALADLSDTIIDRWRGTAPQALIEATTLQTGERGFADGGAPRAGIALVDGAACLPPPLPFGRRADLRLKPATSAPLGEAIARSLAALPGSQRVVIGLADSSCHDAGEGMAAAWALAARRAASQPVTSAADRARLAQDRVRVGASNLETLLAATRDVTLLVAYADDAPLLGLHGISRRLAERRNLDDLAAQAEESRLAGVNADLDAEWTAAGVSRQAPGIGAPSSWPGSGAGGGAALLLARLGARLVAGARWWARESGLDGRLAGADLVVAVTDRLDWRTAETALPVLADLCASSATPLIALARTGMLTRAEQAAAGLVATYLADERAPDRANWLVPLTERVARAWSR